MGDKALFWEDSWDGCPLISSSPILVNPKNRLISLWGDKVKDYKIKTFSKGSHQWIWRSLDGLGLDPDSVKAFEKILSDRNIKQSERNDDLIWASSMDGKYSVKNVYKALVHSES